MTVKDIEQRIIIHTESIATLTESVKNLDAGLSEFKESTGLSIRRSEDSIEKQKSESAQISLRLALAEKELADLKLLIERGRGNRWAVIVVIIGAILSFIGSAIIALYVKPK